MKLTIGAVIVEPGNAAKNKTGSWRAFRPIIDVEKCTGCGLCSIYCPEPAIHKGKPAKIDYDYCKGCGICANECPFHAITMVPEGKR
jgi:pyruvate ferredoxin oxidoreductase delta subunit